MESAQTARWLRQLRFILSLPPSLSTCAPRYLFNLSTSNSAPFPLLVQTCVSGPGLHATHLTVVSTRLINSPQRGGWRSRKSGDEGAKEARFGAVVVVEKST
jgi:hypothetical protein